MGRRLKNKKKIIAGILLFIYLIFLYFPIYWLLTMSFKSRVDIMQLPPKWFTFKPILGSYQWLFSRTGLVPSMQRSAIVTVFVVFFSLLLGVPAAYVLSRFNFKRRKDVEFWIFSTRFMPAVVVIIPFYYLWLKLRLLDTIPALVVTNLALNLPLVIWLMTGFFRGIPLEYDEAARVEGASLITVFYKIILPLVKPGIVSAAILAMLFTWNDYFFAFVITAVNTTLTVALASFVTVGLDVKYEVMAAASVVAAVPSIIFVFFARKGIVAGFRGIAGIGGGK